MKQDKEIQEVYWNWNDNSQYIIESKQTKYVVDMYGKWSDTYTYKNYSLKKLSPVTGTKVSEKGKEMSVTWNAQNGVDSYRVYYINEVKLGEKELTQLFSIIIPRVKNAINLKNMTEDSIKKYMPKELIVKVFLDFDSNDYLIADVRFDYEGNEFNPLEENKKIKFPRNRA